MCIRDSFNSQPLEAYKGKTDYMLVFSSEEEIRKIVPHLFAISKLKVRGIIITAAGIEVDFVSRFFAPQSGVDEDPVTGSAHCALAPFWTERLGQADLIGYQASQRGG